jgi:hypothetical protein
VTSATLAVIAGENPQAPAFLSCRAARRRVKFIWPSASQGSVTISAAQIAWKGLKGETRN